MVQGEKVLRWKSPWKIHTTHSNKGSLRWHHTCARASLHVCFFLLGSPRMGGKKTIPEIIWLSPFKSWFPIGYLLSVNATEHKLNYQRRKTRWCYIDFPTPVPISRLHCWICFCYKSISTHFIIPWSGFRVLPYKVSRCSCTAFSMGFINLCSTSHSPLNFV